MRTWQYRVVKGGTSQPSVQNECDKLGVEGWELVGTSPGLYAYDSGIHVARIDIDWLMIFKRQGQDVGDHS